MQIHVCVDHRYALIIHAYPSALEICPNNPHVLNGWCEYSGYKYFSVTVHTWWNKVTQKFFTVIKLKFFEIYFQPLDCLTLFWNWLMYRWSRSWLPVSSHSWTKMPKSQYFSASDAARSACSCFTENIHKRVNLWGYSKSIWEYQFNLSSSVQKSTNTYKMAG